MEQHAQKNVQWITLMASPSPVLRTAIKNNMFPRVKLGTAYRNWPRHTGGATSRAQHRYAALDSIDGPIILPQAGRDNLVLRFADVVCTGF